MTQSHGLDVARIVADVQEAAAAGDAGEAIRTLASLLETPAPPLPDSDWGAAVAALVAAAEAMESKELSLRASAHLDDLGDVDGAYDLAYTLYEHRLHGFAATVLERALRLSPDDPRLLAELATNLEMVMANRRAFELLAAAPRALAAAPICRYLMGFHAIMCGAIDEAREVLDEFGDHVPEDVAGAVALLEGMVLRAERLRARGGLGAKDLRGWHLALNGSILLHLSPYGFDEGMTGRYAMIGDGYPLCHEAIERLRIVLEATGTMPPRVFSLPDRSSDILARAAAEILELPLVPWPAGGGDEAGLVVAYDMDGFEDVEILERLKRHAPGQILWAHASCWTDAFPYAPDLTTYLYQTNAAPWAAGRLVYRKETGEVERSEADESPETELAGRIVASDFEPIEDGAALVAVADALRDLPEPMRPGLFRREGSRHRQRLGSPVPSGRFA